MSEELPIRAFVATVEGFSDVYTAAISSGKARHAVVSALQEVGYTESGQYKNVRVRRMPEFDNWAKTAKRGCFGYDAVMDQIRISGAKLL